MKGSDVMKNWDKKTWIYNAIIAILFLVTILLVLFFNTPRIVATDTVDMNVFNTAVKELNTKIDNLQLDIDNLKATNNDLQAEIEVLNNKVSTLEKQNISNITTINNLTYRTTRIEGWNKTLYLALINNYTNYGIAKSISEYEKRA